MELEDIFYKDWAKLKELLYKYLPEYVAPIRGKVDPKFIGWK